eukprot:NODE_150_length_15491_cov_0.365644.p7 type:complete len:382 gc:universal NODE_150_length_15491_cov_0.365644:8268-7123(-)
MISRLLRTSQLKSSISSHLQKHSQTVKQFRQQHGEANIGSINVNAIYSGSRGLKTMLWEPSVLDANEGIRFRGLSIPELQQKLKENDLLEHQPESVLWLLLTNEVPTKPQVEELAKDLGQRMQIPGHVEDLIDSCPSSLHPMSQFSIAVLACQSESVFASKYATGMNKSDYWEYTLEDSLNLIAKCPTIASRIYRNLYKDGKHAMHSDSTMSVNYANMLGFTDPNFIKLLNLYLLIHSDHEGGNVSAHASHLVNSALSDPYYSFSAALNGLAGPLHGLANQEVLNFMLQMQSEVGDNPSDSQVKDYIWGLLKSGKVLPGYGHAVLRKTDPRYQSQREFALEHLPNDPLFKLTSQIYSIAPDVLLEHGKTKNPWPNVDAHSG